MGGKRLTESEKIRRIFIKNPNVKARDIAEELGVALKTVYNTRYNMGQKLKFELLSQQLAESLQNDPPVPNFNKKPREKIVLRYDAPDLINNPPHYMYGGIDTIAFIEAKRLGYHLGNVVKYITRAGRKGTTTGLDDLKKARWYIDRAIEKNEGGPVVR